MVLYTTGIAVIIALFVAYLFPDSRFAWIACGTAITLFTEQAIKRWKWERNDEPAN